MFSGVSSFALSYGKSNTVAQQDKDGMSYENQILTRIIPSSVFVTVRSNEVLYYCYF